MTDNKEIITETSLAPIMEAPLDIRTDMESGAADIFASFDISNYEGKVKLFNATSGDGDSLKSQLNKVLEISDVVIMPVDVRGDDGFVSTVPRTTLITKDGRLISATSWGVYNSVKKLHAVFGGLHFDPSLKVSPVEVKTKNGFTMNLRLV